MRFYIDIEATQPENEIIAIGAVAETGATFYSLVKPQFSSISQFVSELTHISPEDLEKAPDINEVLRSFDLWVIGQEQDIMECRFISYGGDSGFIKATLPVITEQHAFTIAAILIAKMEDCYDNIRKFFHGGIKLVHAFNYVQSMEVEQQHDPLEDAIMLQKVFEYTQTHDPLPCHPLNKNFDVAMDNATTKMPSGIFWCTAKGNKRKDFNSCDEAIDWLINEVMKQPDPAVVHRNRVMTNIMKSVRTGRKYCDYRWFRKKEEN